METQSITIDLDIYKAIETHRQSFAESHNDILHRLLLDDMLAVQQPAEQGGLRIRHGVYLPAGTQLRHIAQRSGDRYVAEVVDGGIMFEGEIYQSPSKAAIAAAGNSRNGWIFWEYMDPITKKWQLLDALRKD
ncbi:MAG: hypothetical protein OEZ16_04120 [Chromatiales bacterium]|nr:hypothetical protein [Chromatiales bacterium]